jgi:hypothetical protein
MKYASLSLWKYILWISEFCARAATARESEVEAVLLELRAALREHVRMIRKMAVQTLIPKKNRMPRSKAA